MNNEKNANTREMRDTSRAPEDSSLIWTSCSLVHQATVLHGKTSGGRRAVDRVISRAYLIKWYIGDHQAHAWRLYRIYLSGEEN